jgi:hypothetical protein
MQNHLILLITKNIFLKKIAKNDMSVISNKITYIIGSRISFLNIGDAWIA